MSHSLFDAAEPDGIHSFGRGHFNFRSVYYSEGMSDRSQKALRLRAIAVHGSVEPGEELLGVGGYVLAHSPSVVLMALRHLRRYLWAIGQYPAQYAAMVLS